MERSIVAGRWRRLPKEEDVATFVLVPGAWLGGWAWKDVAARLRVEGHDVYPITLTGLGERAHLARPDVDLEMHITDVINVVKWNDLQDIILVGHSYAGIVITGVADRIAERLSHLVYLDAGPLPDGMAMVDLYPPDGLAAIQQAVDRFGDGWRLPLPSFEILGEGASLAGLDAADRSLMTEKAVAQPWRTYTQPLHLHGQRPATFQQVVIACDDFRGMIAAGIPEIVALTNPPWRVLDLQTGHWPMSSMPAELAQMLAHLSTGT